MLWRGCFMWPLAIAELGLRYLRSNFSERLGHPLRNPLRTVFRRVKILGLHRDWWANLMALAQVCTDPSLHRVREGGQGDFRLDVAGINREVWGTT
jgi:hypothetical protein